MIAPRNDLESLSPPEQGLTMLAVLLPVAWVLFARALWAPGWASVDEAGQVASLQLWREGLALPWRLSWGCLHRCLQFASMQGLGWRIESLHTLAMLLYVAESLLLFLVARAWFGLRAAPWALAINAFSALTFTRLGSVLWFQAVPLEWLLLAAALLRLRGPWASALWGAAAALFLLDYEGWWLALPGLALLFSQDRGARDRVAALAGFALLAGGLTVLSHAWFQSTLQVRLGQTVPRAPGQAVAYLASHLRALVFGGDRTLPYLGVPAHPQVPPWAWVGIAAMAPLWHRHWRLLLAALIPLAALALHSPSVEPNRCLAAWPAFCLLAAAGFARLGRADWKRPLLWLGLLAAAGGAWEMHAYAQGLRGLGPRFYSESWNQLEAGRRLRQGGLVTLLSDLGPRSGADLRFALGLPPDSLKEGPLLAVIPWQDQPRLDPNLGSWQVIQTAPEEAPLLLLSPRSQAGSALRRIDRDLGPLWSRAYDLPVGGQLAGLEQRCQTPLADPRWLTPVWEARFKAARLLGHPYPGEAAQARRLKFLRVDPYLREARFLAPAQPALALPWVERACAQDPRRRDAWQLRLSLLARLNRPRDAAALVERLKADPQAGSLRPEWLQD